MATILGTPLNDLKSGGVYTPETSAKDRVVIGIATYETATLGWTLGAATLGGNAMSVVGAVEGSGVAGQGTTNTYVTVLRLDEPNIPVGSSTLSIAGADSETVALYTVELEPGEDVLSFFSDFGVEPDTLSVAVDVEAGDVLIANAIDMYGGRTFTWSGLVERLYSTNGGWGDWVYSCADLEVSVAETLAITVDSSSGDAAASFSMAGVLIGASNSNTLALDQTSATHGAVLTGTSSILDATSALIKDSSNNTLALVDFTNLTGGDYSFKIPDLTPLLVGVIPGACTIELTNGTDTAVDSIDLVPIAGYSQIIATAQAAGLTEAAWGYVGSGGLDAAATAGDVLWAPIISGLTFLSNGDLAIDSGYTGGQATFWLFDADDSLTWSRVTMTLAAQSGDSTAPVLTSPTASATSDTTASGSVSTDTAEGTLYFLASGNAIESVATVKAGGSQGVSTTGVQGVAVTGLTAETSYYLHFVHTDASANDSDVSTSAQFTTDAAAQVIVPATGNGGYTGISKSIASGI